MRLTIEDSLYADPRFMRFMVKVGDEARALGCMLIAFRLAQKHWCPEKRPVPSAEWSVSGLPKEIIECGLVEEREGGYYVRGSETQFAWYFQRVEAGKKGGRPKAGANRKKPGAKRNEPELTGPNPLTLTPSLTLSPTLPPVFSEGQNSFADVKNPVGFFIGKYVQAYQKRFGDERARPDLRGKVQGLIKRFLEETPLERAVALIETYLSMNDQWFITKGFDFVTFNENVGKIALALDTGKRITQAEARGAEAGDFYRDQMARLVGQGGSA
jgi:hypothetical protein